MRQRFLLLMLLALLAAPAPAAYALINPSLQPKDLFDRYKTVAVLRVAEIDGEATACTLNVEDVVKGMLAAKRVRLRAKDESAQEAFSETISPGLVIVAFVGKVRRRGADTSLFYLGDGRWGVAEIADQGDPLPWLWTEDLEVTGAQSLFGTFNGRNDRLAELVKDIADGHNFFPAKPFTTFKQDLVIGSLSSKVTGIALEDLDGDGDLDVYACSSGGDRLFLQTSPLLFTDATAERIPSVPGSPSVSVADVNGDGRPDLLLGGEIWLARAAGFAASSRLPERAAEAVKCATFADMNKDGWPDVVISRDRGGLQLYFHAGSPDGGYNDATGQTGLADIEPCRSGNGFFCVGDCSGDGLPDLFYSVGRGLLLTQHQDGRFTAFRSRLVFDFTTNWEEQGLTGAGCMAGLWRGDSTDIVVANDGSIYLASVEDGRLADVTAYGNEVTEEVELGLIGALAEDLNADGNVDVYAINREGRPNVFYLNRGYGSFMTPHKYGAATFPGEAHHRGAWSVVAGDIDGDGANDLVLGGTDGTVTVIVNDSLSTRRREKHPSSQQRVLDVTALLSVRVLGGRGVCGAEISLVDVAGRVVGRRVLAAQMVTGSCGPAVVNLAVRTPGRYTLRVRYADGLSREQTVDLSRPGHLVRVAVTRGE